MLIVMVIIITDCQYNGMLEVMVMTPVPPRRLPIIRSRPAGLTNRNKSNVICYFLGVGNTMVC